MVLFYFVYKLNLVYFLRFFPVLLFVLGIVKVVSHPLYKNRNSLVKKEKLLNKLLENVVVSENEYKNFVFSNVPQLEANLNNLDNKTLFVVLQNENFAIVYSSNCWLVISGRNNFSFDLPTVWAEEKTLKDACVVFSLLRKKEFRVVDVNNFLLKYNK